MSKLDKLQNMSGIPLSVIKEKEATRKLLPTRNDVKNKPGYWEREKPGGGYEWGVPLRTMEANEAMKPFAQADVARVAKVYGFPGDYGGRGKRTDARQDGTPAHITDFSKDFCENCDRLNVWCDCEMYP